METRKGKVTELREEHDADSPEIGSNTQIAMAHSYQKH
jgi:hypothetical protein